jgi:hypothetical protein
MTYHIVSPPFTLKFFEMSKHELREYAAWFHGAFDERISELTATVRATHGYAEWEANFEPESLRQLGEWFASAVTTRPRTTSEIDELKARSDLQVSVSSAELTNESFSLAIDVGMYLARTFERSYPQLAWKQFLKDKRDADYGQPVLIGFGKAALNPVRIAVTIAYASAAGKRTGQRLWETFDYWSSLVNEPRQ